MPPGVGVLAVVNAQYSNFVVHEVDLNGNIACLTDQDLPVDASKLLKQK
jgi:hypothetical protein